MTGENQGSHTGPNHERRAADFDAAAPAPPAVNERFERGLAVMQAIDPEQTVRILSAFSPVAPDLAAYLVEYAFGDIASRPGLDLKLREFAAVAALAALGTAGPQLKARLHGALKLGWTEAELVELLMQISVHAGFPAAINALAQLRELLEEIP